MIMKAKTMFVMIYIITVLLFWGWWDAAADYTRREQGFLLVLLIAWGVLSLFEED